MKHHLSTYIFLAFGLACIAAMVASAGMGASSWLARQHAGPMHVGKGPNPENGPFICLSRSGAHDYCGASQAILQLLFNIVLGFLYGPHEAFTWSHIAEFFLGIFLIAASLLLVEHLPIQRRTTYLYFIFVLTLILTIAFIDFVLWR